jgi:hypothetical protein
MAHPSVNSTMIRTDDSNLRLATGLLVAKRLGCRSGALYLSF